MSSPSNPPAKKRRTHIVPLVYRPEHVEGRDQARLLLGRGGDKQTRQSTAAVSSTRTSRAQSAKSPTATTTDTPDIPLPDMSPPSPRPAISPPSPPPAPTQQKAPTCPRRTTAKQREPLDPDLHLTSYASDVMSLSTPFQIVDRRTWLSASYHPTEEMQPTAASDWQLLRRWEDMDKGTQYLCDCPDTSAFPRCIHMRFLEEHEGDIVATALPSIDGIVFAYHHCSYVQRDDGSDEPVTSDSAFVVSPPSHAERTNVSSVIVHRHHRKGSAPLWTCSKDSTKARLCLHVARVRNFLDADGNLKDLFAEGATDIHRDVVKDLERRAAAVQMTERAVSHAPIGPPLWARLPSDDAAGITTHTTPMVIPKTLPFTAHELPRCRCGWTATTPPHPNDIRTIPCTVYDASCVTLCEIQVVDCPTCPSRFRHAAGPDLGTLGLYNYNNARVVTHRLLNGFSSTMTKLPTTFDGYSTIIQRAYETDESEKPFMSADQFRAVWFGFAQLQYNSHAFECYVCGKDPEVIVADGVSAGFDRKQVRASLRPPTTVDSTSPVVDDVVRHEPSPLVRDRRVRQDAIRLVRWRRDLRKDIIEALLKNEPVTDSPPSDGDTDSDDGAEDDALDAEAEPVRAARMALKEQRTSRQKVLARGAANLKAVKTVTAAILVTSKRKRGDDATDDEVAGRRALSAMFEAHMSLDGDKASHALYWSLLEQLLAHESVLQLASQKSWALLKLMGRVSDATEGKDEQTRRPILMAVVELLRVEIPALGLLAERDVNEHASFSEDLLCIADWIYMAALRSLEAMRTHPAPDRDADLPPDEDWHQTGSYYPRGRVRVRPDYINLKGDGKVERNVVTGEDGIGCPKYYAMYGKGGLTGGLMVLWCTHSVCYGFHCIPKGEGRDDLFSSLYCYFEKMPRWIIYDFACALAPYFMAREPDLFKDVKAVCDKFHGGNHAYCSLACMMTNYIKTNPSLNKYNSSAAESGNSAMALIRKTMSYMSQSHAIILVQIFLSLWNRMKQRKMQKA